MNTSKITLTNLKTGETIGVNRSVTCNHPEWVHTQLGTRSEGDLQRYLDQCHVSDWYRDGKHLGDDVAGLSLFV